MCCLSLMYKLKKEGNTSCLDRTRPRPTSASRGIPLLQVEPDLLLNETKHIRNSVLLNPPYPCWLVIFFPPFCPWRLLPRHHSCHGLVSTETCQSVPWNVLRSIFFSSLTDRLPMICKARLIIHSLWVFCHSSASLWVKNVLFKLLVTGKDT